MYSFNYFQLQRLEKQHLDTLAKEWEKREKDREAQLVLVKRIADLFISFCWFLLIHSLL
jgi:hypothetical protein